MLRTRGRPRISTVPSSAKEDIRKDRFFTQARKIAQREGCKGNILWQMGQACLGPFHPEESEIQLKRELSQTKSRRQQIVRLQDFWMMRCGIKRNERTRILDRGALPDLQTSNAGIPPDYRVPAMSPAITPPF
ncbi:hypothetical protein TNCV_699721 [Trichonephila clavipes]|nr:hypothetical protein TNCV_699721 [Trichonephila clavipes]